MGCAIPPQKTHSIAFELRRLCYPWHPWYDRSILTRAAGGARADVAYFCKLPDAPPGAMLVETPRWMFDASQCATMQLAESACVDCETLRALKNTIAEQRVPVKRPVIQPQLFRQAGHGDTDGKDSRTNVDEAVNAVWATPRRTTVARSRRSDARRGSHYSGATAAERSCGQAEPCPTTPGRPR